MKFLSGYCGAKSRHKRGWSTALTTDALTQNAINSTTHALVSAVTRLSIQGGKLDWEAVAADTIYAMQEGLRDQYRNSTGTTGADGQQASSDQSKERLANAQEELRFKLGEGVAQVNQGNSLNGQANEVYSAMLDAFQNVSAQTSAIGAGTLYAQNTLTDPTNPVTMTDAGSSSPVTWDGPSPLDSNDRQTHRSYIGYLLNPDATPSTDELTAGKTLLNKYGYSVGARESDFRDQTLTVDQKVQLLRGEGDAALPYLQPSAQSFLDAADVQLNDRYALFSTPGGGSITRPDANGNTRTIRFDFDPSSARLAESLGVSFSEARAKTNWSAYEGVIDAAFQTEGVIQFVSTGCGDQAFRYLMTISEIVRILNLME